MPPNGRSGVVQVGWLTNTMPASMRLATRLPRAISLVKTDPPNPKSESLASATNNQAGYYSVIVTNNYGSITSSAAKLTVTAPASAPTFTQQPQNLTVTNGNPASFTNAASGTAPLYYQWYFNTNTPVSGGTNAILFIASATNNQAGYYSVIVTNFAGSATSSAALLTVIVPTTGPIVTQQPQDYTVI